jgi:cytoskeletal protein CcmA (bactofilin family)
VFRRRRVRFLLLGPVFLAAAALSASVVMAQGGSLGGKLLSGDIVTIPVGETVAHDVYVFAGTATINGTVRGDLTVAAGEVQINGTVDGDVLAAGGSVSVAGTVTGDLREAGGQLTVSGNVAQDVVAAGGQLAVLTGSKVGEDLIVSAGDVSLDGAVAGSVFGSAGSYRRGGTVGGAETVAISENQPSAPTPTNAALDALRHYVTVLIIGGLALWLFPRAIRAAEEAVRRRPLAAFLSGLLTLVVYIVLLVAALVVIVLAAVILGIASLDALVVIDVVAGVLAICAVTLAFVVAAAFLADAVVGLALARLVAQRYITTRWAEIALLAAGAAVVVLATSLPVIGGLLKLLVVVFGLGALGMWAYAHWWPGRAPVAPEVAAGPS